MLRPLCWTALAALITAYSVVTINQEAVWYNTETLWSRVIDVQPMRSGASYFARGKHYYENGEYKKALQDINTSIEIAMKKNHKHIDLNYSVRGEIYAGMGNYQEAINDYSRAISISPDKNPEYYYRRGMIFQIVGRPEEAKRDLTMSQYLSRQQH